jgi:site-specific DNA recombinase
MSLAVVGYIRVSTDNGAQEISLDLQEKQIRAYCSAFGYQLVGVCRDESSGSNIQRPGLQEALRLLENGEAQSLLVAKLDRLTRSVRDLSSMLEGVFKTHGLLSIGEAVDTGSPQGRLFLNIMTSVSNWERETISSRISAALRHIQQVEKRHVGRIPFGYVTDGKGNLSRNNEEMKVIRLCVALRAKGMTLQSICEDLKGKGFKTRSGTDFSPAFVRKLAMAA